MKTNWKRWIVIYPARQLEVFLRQSLSLGEINDGIFEVACPKQEIAYS